jgi:rhamnosyltransferase
VLAQAVEGQVDICVRDDGSTDGTRDILEQYAQAGKLRWYTGENLKPAKSFLDLVKRCPGYDFYAFSDQDDRWYPDKLEQGIARIRQDQGPAMSFANARLVDSQLNDLGRNVYNRIPHSDFYSVTCGGGILGCTVIFNRAVAELIAAYGNPEKLIMHDSYAAILCTLFDGRIVFDAAPHMDYRQHGSNAVGTNWTKWDALKDRFYRITKGDDITVAHMAQSILAQDPQVPNKDKLAFLQKVADYPKSFGSAVSLALDTRPRYNGLSMQITMRLAMLFRNR